MRRSTRALSGMMVLAWVAGACWADGMIVPVRRELRVRGSWAVKYHKVNVRVREQVASVHIDQAFVNTGAGMIEVEYLFPIPPHAAIDSMTMMVDGKEFSGKLMKADEARRIYNDIVRQKQDPALLEYAGFGLYKTSAFPLQPGKPCQVVVTYKDVCRKDGDLVEVWYPLNTEKFSAKALEEVSVKVDIKAGADITAVYSPTHELKVRREDPRHVIASYEARNSLPVSDFQVFYKAHDEAVGATLITQSDPEKDGYFLLLVSPNPRSGSQKITPKDVVIALDHSGSMAGEKLEQAKAAVAYLLKNLNPVDRFNVVAYSDSVEGFFKTLQTAGPEAIAEANQRLDVLDPAGGTNIHDALSEVIGMLNGGSEPAAAAAPPQYVVFLTDGQPTIGKTKEADILAAVKKANAGGARLFVFGVGYDVNVRLLDRLVVEHGGRSDYVKPKERIEAKIASLSRKIKNPVMTDLSVSVTDLRLRDTFPRPVGDLFDGDQVLLTGRYDRLDASKLPSREAGVHQGTLMVEGLYEGQRRSFEYPVTVRSGGRDARFTFVEKLWAVRRVGWLLDQIQLSGQKQELIDELVRLSTTYGIMTPYTSFLADDTGRLARGGELRHKAGEALKRLDAVTGADGQIGAKNRQVLREAQQVPAPSGPGQGGGMYGWRSRQEYEGGAASRPVANVRTVGNQALYRQGHLWVAPELAGLDLVKDADKIQEIRRFSPAYFKLAEANTVEENQVLAGQRGEEELLVRLRGQVYRIR